MVSTVRRAVPLWDASLRDIGRVVRCRPWHALLNLLRLSDRKKKQKAAKAEWQAANS